MIWIEILSAIVIWLSFWSLIPRDEWWFRGADFPRLQILFIGIIAFFLLLFWQGAWDLKREIIFVLLIAALAFQLKMVLPYTFLWKKQVAQVRSEQLDSSKQISVLVSNVLTPNDQYHLLIEHIQKFQPDLVLCIHPSKKEASR